MLTTFCGWSLEYVDRMEYPLAVWHVENLERMRKENSQHLAEAVGAGFGAENKELFKSAWPITVPRLRRSRERMKKAKEAAERRKRGV